MPTQAELAEYVKANQSVRKLALRDIGTLWAKLVDLPAAGQRDALLEAMPLLVARFGEIAGTVAADFYELQRDYAGGVRSFMVEIADVADTEAVRASTRWAVDPLFREEMDRDAVLRRLGEVLDDRALGQGKRTLVANAQRDPAKPKVARVPVGTTCAWCRMLASRGAVYASQATALAASHAHCDCVPTPLWADSQMPVGYDPEDLYEQYRRAAKAAGSGSPKAITAELRKQQGIA